MLGGTLILTDFAGPAHRERQSRLGYQGAGIGVHTPTKGSNLGVDNGTCNSLLTRVRAIGERANALLGRSTPSYSFTLMNGGHRRRRSRVINARTGAGEKTSLQKPLIGSPPSRGPSLGSLILVHESHDRNSKHLWSLPFELQPCRSGTIQLVQDQRPLP